MPDALLSRQWLRDRHRSVFGLHSQRTRPQSRMAKLTKSPILPESNFVWRRLLPRHLETR
jgi:hypothetical protein